MKSNETLVPRYRLTQRIWHWLFTLAFLVLLFSGLALFIPAVSVWTASETGRLVHRIAAVVLIVTPILYAITDWDGFSQLIHDSFSYDSDDIAWFKYFIPYVFGKAKNLPPQGRINAGEKIHHASIIVGIVVVAASGLVLWLWKGISPSGYMIMLIIHDIAMFVLAILTIGHIFFVFVYGALSGMWNGYVTETYAKLEHPKWLAQMKREGKLTSH